MGKIGIFGGSFNPPHIGHILAAEEMLRCLELDRLYLVPAAVPPHKKLAPDSPDAAGRKRLLELALAGHPGLDLCDLELQRGGTSYTADTLAQLRQMHPGDTLYLLMGSDMFLSLHEWYKPESVLAQGPIVLMRRQTEDPELEEKLARQQAALEREYGARVIRAENRFVDLSSTRVRRMLAFGCGEAYLDPAVHEEIMRQGYYGVHEDLRNLPMERLRRKVVSLLKPARVAHVLGCCNTAAELARRWGADEIDAARAGMLHDITKALNAEEQLILCEKYDIMISGFERENPKLLHAKTGATIAREVFGENDAVFDAIWWHTTGTANMNLLQKILYLADYMEPNRKFDGVQLLRDQVAVDIDLALYTALEMSVQVLEEKGALVDYNSRSARDYMKQQLEGRERNKEKAYTGAELPVSQEK